MDHDEQQRKWWAAKAERQQKEIATIKPRTFLIDLSDADVDRLAREAANAGMTMADLLKSFIGDLVDGTYSNGSDERACADAWYARCGFSHLAETNIALLAREGSLDTVYDGWEDYQSAKAEAEYLRKVLDDPEQDVTVEDVEDAEKWAAESRQKLEDVIKEAKCEGTMEEVAAEVLAWFENANTTKGDKVNLSWY